MLMAGLLAIGCWQLGEGSWIYAKAGLAQFLLQRAWCRALAGEAMPKPWPWADTATCSTLRVWRPVSTVIGGRAMACMSAPMKVLLKS